MLSSVVAHLPGLPPAASKAMAGSVATPHIVYQPAFFALCTIVLLSKTS